MKRLFTLLIVSAYCVVSVQAQKKIYLTINHKLGDQDFVLGTAAETPEGVQFDTKRLQYYLSKLELVYDGGNRLPISETWFLVDGSKAFTESLGTHNINNLEELRFAVGVEESANHKDPAQYPGSHPLAPKSPSMHWGWQAGYRFVAVEGKAGANLDFNYELHALGDRNYFQTIVPTQGVTTDSTIEIILNADYEMAFKGIDPSDGLVVHDEFQEAITIMQNFNQFVFTSSEGNASMVSVEELERMQTEVFPNPSSGEVILTREDVTSTASIRVMDIQGRIILEQVMESAELKLHLPKAGVYFIRMHQEGMLDENHKVIVQ